MTYQFPFPYPRYIMAPRSPSDPRGLEITFHHVKYCCTRSIVVQRPSSNWLLPGTTSRRDRHLVYTGKLASPAWGRLVARRTSSALRTRYVTCHIYVRAARLPTAFSKPRTIRRPRNPQSCSDTVTFCQMSHGRMTHSHACARGGSADSAGFLGDNS